jgi:hypothetical protein
MNSHETDDPFANPIDTENRSKGEKIDIKARVVLLDREGNAVGDCDNNEEVPAVVLHFFFHNDPYENRIDVRIAHRREKGSKKRAPDAELNEHSSLGSNRFGKPIDFISQQSNKFMKRTDSGTE